MKKFIWLLAAVVVFACQPTSAPHKFGAPGGTRPPITNPNWAVTAWFIDPANQTTCASDANNGTSATCGAAGSGIGPLLTVNELNYGRWGCIGNPTGCPILNQATTITALSTEPTTMGEADPFIFRPLIGKQALVTLQGALNATTQIATGTMTLVSSKNRATNTNLVETLVAGSSKGDLIVNATHPSRAIVRLQVAGNNYSIDQPMSGTGFATNYPLPVEVDTWASDSFTEYRLAGLNIVAIEPTYNDPGTSASTPSSFTPLVVTQLTFLNPPAGNNSLSGAVNAVRLNGAMLVADNDFKRHVTSWSAGTEPSIRLVDNAYEQLFTIGSTPVPYDSSSPSTSPDGFPNQANIPSIFGGSGYTSQTQSAHACSNCWVDFDFAATANATVGLVVQGTFLYGCMQLQGSAKLWVSNAMVFPMTVGACSTNGIIWGGSGARVVAEGTSRITYPGATATATFLGVTLLMNGQINTACGHSGASVDVINCGVTLNVANLDAAQGVAGFGGLAFMPGGGAFSSTQ
jgi:hypothetical protein